MSRTALICDDDPILRGVVAEMVAEHGWDTSETATAKGAILLADLLQPDLVIMDVALVGMSGLEATPRIHEDCPDARIVVLSALDIPRPECLAAGADDVLQKHELPRFDELLRELSGEG